jgi:hypothetical protein
MLGIINRRYMGYQKQHSVPNSNIDFSVVDCSAGYVHSKTITATPSPKYFPQHKHNKNFMRHLPTLMRILTNDQHHRGLPLLEIN